MTWYTHTYSKTQTLTLLTLQFAMLPAREKSAELCPLKTFLLLWPIIIKCNMLWRQRCSKTLVSAWCHSHFFHCRAINAQRLKWADDSKLQRSSDIIVTSLLKLAPPTNTTLCYGRQGFLSRVFQFGSGKTYIKR